MVIHVARTGLQHLLGCVMAAEMSYVLYVLQGQLLPVAQHLDELRRRSAACVAQHAGKFHVAVLQSTDDAVLVCRHHLDELPAIACKVAKLALEARGNETGLQ